MTILKSERLRLTLAMAVVVPAGLAVKFCVPGALGRWCSLYGAAILYEVLWVLVLRLIVPRLRPVTCGVIVFVVTCALEFLQLWHLPALDAVRRTFLGAALLGTSFDPWDFVYYVIGSALGVLVALAMRRGT
ncbi:DUF2809 domain-containing protein [Verrucomicrobiota bacterium]